MSTDRHGPAADVPRAFIVGSTAAAAGGLALGWHLPAAIAGGVRPAAAKTGAGSPAEVNAWVVIKPDENGRGPSRPLPTTSTALTPGGAPC